MRKYFYTDGTNNYGPFDLDELKARKIKRDTLVWFDDLDDWKPAGEIAELSGVFRMPPPPLVPDPAKIKQLEELEAAPYPQPVPEPELYPERPPKNWLIESILATVFCCLPFGIAGIVHAAKVDSRFHAGDIDGAYESAKEAKKWTMVSFWIGVGVIVLYVIVMIVGLVLGSL